MSDFSQKGFRISPRHALWILFVVGAVLRLWGLGSKPFWSAEIQEIFGARCPLFYTNLDDAGSDLLGYFYHFVVWCAGLFPLEFFDRLANALAGVAAIWVAYAWGRYALDRRAGLIAALLTTVSFLMVDISQTARFYMVCTVAGNGATILLLEALEKNRVLPTRRLVAIWILDSIAILSHGGATGFVAAQLFVVCLVCFHEKRDFKLGIRNALRVLVPLIPAVLAQAAALVSFSPKMGAHSDYFMHATNWNLDALAVGLAAVLSGTWLPVLYIFGTMVIVGGAVLWNIQPRKAWIFGGAALIPLGVFGVLIGVMGQRTLDMTFASFLFAPYFALFSVASVAAGELVTPARRKWAQYGARIATLLVIGSNLWLVYSYHQASTKPTMGPDVRSLAGALEEMELNDDDWVFYRYDEFFTNLAFYAADSLSSPNLAARHIPPGKLDFFFGYIHRLRGCSDRPRIDPERVRTFEELESDSSPLNGRVVVVAFCQNRRPPPVWIPENKRQELANLAAWVLSQGRQWDNCEEVASKFVGFETLSWPGVVLAYRNGMGKSVGEWSAIMEHSFSQLHPGILRLTQEP